MTLKVITISVENPGILQNIRGAPLTKPLEGKELLQ
jgi:hypothetical protein